MISSVEINITRCWYRLVQMNKYYNFRFFLSLKWLIFLNRDSYGLN
jgi:hypothetical protein